MLAPGKFVIPGRKYDGKMLGDVCKAISNQAILTGYVLCVGVGMEHALLQPLDRFCLAK